MRRPWAIVLPCVLLACVSVACGGDDWPPPGDGGGDAALSDGGTSDATTRDGGTDGGDPCAGRPTCAAAGVACDGDELVACSPDPAGCLIETRTDCASSPGGLCDDSGATPLCVLSPDPCDSLPASERCATSGTSCTDATTLETCAPNAFGCLVRTPTDCSERASGTCDPTVPAACAFTGDPCAGIATCGTPGSASCDGPDLVECHRDGFGCYVETRTTCTDAPFGFCDATATPRPMCGTAATDPCLGMTECTPVGRTCDSDTLHVCATNAFGCDVESTTACDATGDVCDDSGALAACVDPCTLVTECPLASYCDGLDAVVCAPDANGCLVESARETCTGLCEVSTSTATAECIADTLCPEAVRGFIDCSSGTVSSTTVGGTMAIDAYPGCTPLNSYEGPERIFRFRNDRATEALVTITSGSSMMSVDHDLFVLDADLTTRSCTSDIDCLEGSTGGTAVETVDFRAAPGDIRYVVFDDYGGLPASPIPFTLTISCTPIRCGDGVVASVEACDDANTANGDGCSSSCEVEPGYACTGAPSACGNVCGNGVVDASEGCDDGDMTAGDGCSAHCEVEPGYVCPPPGPTTCVMTAANATCATARMLTSPATVMATTTAGGARPTGPGCGSPPGFGALFYSVAVPAGETISANLVPDAWDAVLVRMDGCSLGCAATSDLTGTAAEQLTYTNGGASTATVTFAVFPYTSGAGGGGDFTLRIAPIVCGDGVIAAGEGCDDDNTTDGDGCSHTCQTELGYSCTGEPSACTREYTVTPIAAACVSMTAGTDVMALGDDAASPIAALPFAFSYFGDAVTHYSVTSNGYVQLWPSAAGTPSTSYGNGPIPGPFDPRGMVAPFWDDLNTVTATTLRSRVIGTTPNRRLVVEWNGWTPYGMPSDSLRFQIWLRETSSQIELHYCSLTGSSRVTGDSATIGAEDLSGTRAVQISVNTAGAVMTGSGWRLTP